MKKVKKVIMTLLPSTFVLALVLPISMHLKPKIDEAGEDTAIYSPDGADVKDYNQPDFQLNSDDDDDDDEPFVAPDKVRIHYFNESGVTGTDKGKQRAFYIWANGVDGMEVSRFENNVYDPAAEGDDNIIYSVNDEGTMMTIDIDYSKPLFAPYGKDGKGRSSLMFIIKFEKIDASNLNWGGQSEDTQLSFRTFAPVNGLTEVWAMSSGNTITILDSYNKTQVHGVRKADFVDWKTIHCEVTNDTKKVDWKLYAFDETYFKIKPKKRADYEKNYLVKEGSNSGSEFDITLKYDAHINVVYSLVSHDPESDVDPDMAKLDKTAKVGFEELYFTEKFHTYYENTTLNRNSDKPLGMTYHSDGSATFRVWSPIAANMSLMLYDDGTPTEYSDATHPGDDKAKGYHMAYKSGGIWEVTITGANLKGKYYNYQVDNYIGTNVTMDPYATSSGVCGVRGYIYDKNASDVTPTGWSAFNAGPLATPQDLSIYEVHVQDLTSDDSWNGPVAESGTYNGFVHAGTHLDGHNDIPTGYDHLKGLGINAVQLTPVFDHDNDERPSKIKYNWGYNPLNYNIVEGGYSSDPFDGATRVKEFRNLVLQMSKGTVPTRVIMDVVYNHVSSASASNFNKLMPRYYFRYARADHFYEWWKDGKKQYGVTNKGDMFDGSGCSNEVATERPMMRKFIVDSLCMWAEDYNIKGFRFDLMGLIDYKTLQEAQKELYEIDPTIYMYGECWTGSSYEHDSFTAGGYHGEGSKEWWEENNPDRSPSGKQPTTFGAFRWQVFNECDPGKLNNGNAIYLGGFNDKYRDLMRGGNNSWYDSEDGKYHVASGLLQNGNLESTYKDDSDHNNIEDLVRGLWGNNHTDGVWGWDPKKSVNYVSCHDNFTFRDQLYDSVAYWTGSADNVAELVIRSSITGHALTFTSNSPAFIQGGEELFRTKELDWDPTNPDEEHKKYQVKPSDCAYLHGHWICHNTYNTPAYVNAFDWDNKLSLTVDGKTVNTSSSGWDIYARFQEMIKMHNNTAKKANPDALSTDGQKQYDGLMKMTSGTATHDPTYVNRLDDTDATSALWEIHGAPEKARTSVCFTVNNLIVYVSMGYDYDNTGIDSRGRQFAGSSWGAPALKCGTGDWGDSGHTWMKMDHQFAILIYETDGDIMK